MRYPFDDILIEARKPKASQVCKILLGSALLLLFFLAFCSAAGLAL
jgi:hypothetical protein